MVSLAYCTGLGIKIMFDLFQYWLGTTAFAGYNYNIHFTDLVMIFYLIKKYKEKFFNKSNQFEIKYTTYWSEVGNSKPSLTLNF